MALYLAMKIYESQGYVERPGGSVLTDNPSFKFPGNSHYQSPVMWLTSYT